ERRRAPADLRRTAGGHGLEHRHGALRGRSARRRVEDRETQPSRRRDDPAGPAARAARRLGSRAVEPHPGVILGLVEVPLGLVLGTHPSESSRPEAGVAGAVAASDARDDDPEAPPPRLHAEQRYERPADALPAQLGLNEHARDLRLALDLVLPDLP